MSPLQKALYPPGSSLPRKTLQIPINAQLHLFHPLALQHHQLLSATVAADKGQRCGTGRQCWAPITQLGPAPSSISVTDVCSPGRVWCHGNGTAVPVPGLDVPEDSPAQLFPFPAQGTLPALKIKGLLRTASAKEHK